MDLHFTLESSKIFAVCGRYGVMWVRPIPDPIYLMMVTNAENANLSVTSIFKGSMYLYCLYSGNLLVTDAYNLHLS